VFSFVPDPVGLGLVQSLPRPGGNITGVTSLVPGGLMAKGFEMVRELLPNARRLAILWNPTNEAVRLMITQEVPLASRYDLQVDLIEARTREELPGAIEKAKTLGADAVSVIGDAIFQTPPDRVPELMAQAKLPAIYSFRLSVQAGGLIAYNPDFTWIVRRHAHLVNSVLRGTPPSEVPVEQPAKYDVVINLKTAKALGLTVPLSLLARADEVFE
jgi:putative ABC transport system substrate-binding protein